jgi:hypothetical protein
MWAAAAGEAIAELMASSTRCRASVSRTLRRFEQTPRFRLETQR